MSLCSQVLSGASIEVCDGSLCTDFEFQTFSEQEDQLYYLIRNKSLVGEPKPAYTEPFPRTDEGWLELTQDKVQVSVLLFVKSHGCQSLFMHLPQTAHAVWYHRKQYIIDGFSAKFSFEVTNRSKTSGDGLAFVIQDEGQSAAGDGTAVPVGSSGMGIGYSGISDSIAVEFDMYRVCRLHIRSPVRTLSICGGGAFAATTGFVHSFEREGCLSHGCVGRMQDDNFNDPDDNHISVHSGGAGPNNGDERLPSDGGTLLPSSPKNIYTPPFRMSVSTEGAVGCFVVSPHSGSHYPAIVLHYHCFCPCFCLGLCSVIVKCLHRA